MKTRQDRRMFLKTGALLGAGVLIQPNISSLFANSSLPPAAGAAGLAVVQGDDYYVNTVKSIEALGGMKKFIGNNSKVGLLVNSRYNKPGTYVKPEITLAVINQCLAAGAKEIISLENVTGSYWKLSGGSKKHTDVINRIKNSGEGFTEVAIPKAVSLKKAEVKKSFLECDVYINIPIFKQHEGIKITGCLKNLMGLTSYSTNQYFHFGTKAKGWYEDVTFLSQCIADINLLRKPDLCIADATEYITTNGPFGPGNVARAKKVVAGTDIVAVDALGATILGYAPGEILPIKLAHQLGLGEIDLAKISVKEIKG
ncbi:MAG: DUF362 domain-containing protein [Ignavibacteriae bacterium]|nr:MAG: DUF362 domain-containing protein [Ignavibacteriota bacterium]